MAQDNMKEIMDNYQDMSLEQLGSSLLGRQSKINAERARQQRKDERIQKIIGGLLATQAISGQIGRAPSELQSHSDLVCRLLLEKKNHKKKKKKH